MQNDNKIMIIPKKRGEYETIISSDLKWTTNFKK